MKRILILVLLVGFNTFAEDHGAEATSVIRPPVDPQQQLNRLNELISACSPGRPGASDVGAGAAAPGSVFIPPVTNIPPSTLSGSGSNDIKFNEPQPSGGNASNGALIYQNRCIPCHAATKGAPALAGTAKLSKIAEVQSGDMPKDGALSASDKADLLAFLNELTQ